MKLVYGIPKNETERHAERLLCENATTEAQVQIVKEIASKEGFHDFRIVDYDPTSFEKPDFIKTISKNIMGQRIK